MVYGDKLHISVREIQSAWMWLAPIIGLNPFFIKNFYTYSVFIIMVKQI